MVEVTQQDIEIATEGVQYDMESNTFVTLSQTEDGIAVYPAQVEGDESLITTFDSLEQCWDSDSISLHTVPERAVDDPVEYMKEAVIQRGMDVFHTNPNMNEIGAMYSKRATTVVSELE